MKSIHERVRAKLEKAARDEQRAADAAHDRRLRAERKARYWVKKHPTADAKLIASVSRASVSYVENLIRQRNKP